MLDGYRDRLPAGPSAGAASPAGTAGPVGLAGPAGTARSTVTYDELVRPDGSPRPAWDVLAPQGWDTTALRAARQRAARLLEDDGVTYTPPGAARAGRGEGPAGGSGAARAGRWRLDPLPTVLAAEEWEEVEQGVAQRVRLLEAVLADLDGPRRLLTAGLLPPELLWRHLHGVHGVPSIHGARGGHLRATWGVHPAGRPRLALAGVDLGRDADGRWLALGDRTQAPSGLGYAMENRRVVARLHSDASRRAPLRRLTGFFNLLRDALADLAPAGVEDPRVVVLTPGRLSETAFDQAYIASLLGFPLVSGADLVMRDGQVWTRELGDRRPVDVLLRRVDDTWCDPLELRPDSELGVPGLVEAIRRGNVVTANALGSGLVESAALHPFLPVLCRALLDEPLALPSAPAWWTGDPVGLATVLDRLDRLVLRPVDPARGRGVHGPGLTHGQLERWRARLAAEPGAWVGQEALPLSTTPTVAGAGLEPRPLTVRAFAVARGGSWTVMPGALGTIVPETVNAVTGRREGPVLAKDVWVLERADGAVAPVGPEAEPVVVRPSVVPMVPQALENLFWLGRYTERAEATTRHLLVLRGLADELPTGRADPARRALEVLARALGDVTGTATPAVPGAAGGPGGPSGPSGGAGDDSLDAGLRRLLVDRDLPGSVAQALDGVAGAAGAVRDQLSSDVFTVLGGLERARAALAAPDAPAIPAGSTDVPGHGEGAEQAGGAAGPLGARVTETGVRVLSGTLALCGITAENMVRDVGWQLLDVGRGLERALQTTALLRWVVGDVHPPAVERHLVAAVLTAGESVVTHRRRYAGREGVESMLELMLRDPANPRSVAFQVARVRDGVARLPLTGALEGLRAELLGELAEVEADLAARGAADLASSYPRVPEEGTAAAGELFTEHRDELVALAERVRTRLHRLADLADGFFAHPTAPRPLGSVFPDRPAATVGEPGQPGQHGTVAS